MNPPVRVDQKLPPAQSSPFESTDDEVDGTRASSDSRPVLDRLKALEPRTSERGQVTVPKLADGEQYRFHFDMTRCIGCRCCEVACNEQNNNPPEVMWRRVGEIEGGSYPNVTRLHVSMACNHCLEPSCLEGCPVDAYTKLDNGIVDHDAEACIGCQYCIWNCPYGVPQYHPERRVVTKCHLCVGRLEDGELPACVAGCPTNAIEIESVNVAEWREKIAEAEAPGVPPADLALSTTRITVPDDLPPTMGDVDARMLQPEAAHWSLVFFLVLSQWSVGLFAVVPAFLAERSVAAWMSGAAFVLGHAGLVAALFHLGRPIHAVRAMKAWRHSWLSREVIAFSLFAAASALALGIGLGRWLDLEAPALLLSTPVFLVALGCTTLLGIAGIACSVGIYRIPARPAWDSVRTPLQFFATTVLFGGGGSLLAWSLGAQVAPAYPVALPAALVTLSALILLFAPWQLVLQGVTTREPALRGAAILWTRHFRRLFFLRTALLCGLAGLAPIAAALEPGLPAIFVTVSLLVLAVVSEFIGRYLFFVTVVPRNMPGSFFTTRPAHG